MIKFVPVKDKDILTFIWYLPYCEKLFKTKPLNFISSLVGHEGPNSLLSFLIKEDLANSLSSYVDNDLDCLTSFNIDITLTQNGFKNWH